MSLLMWAVATFFTSQRWQNQQDFFFLLQRICKSRWSLPASQPCCTRLTVFLLEHTGKCETLSPVKPGSSPLSSSVLVLYPGAAFPAIFPLSSETVGEKSSSKEMMRLWIRVFTPYLSPKSSKAFSCILFTSFPCQIPLDKNRAWQEGRKKEIT